MYKNLYFNKKERVFLHSETHLDDDDMWIKMSDSVSDTEYSILLCYINSHDEKGKITETKAFKYFNQCIKFVRLLTFEKRLKISGY